LYLFLIIAGTTEYGAFLAELKKFELSVRDKNLRQTLATGQKEDKLEPNLIEKTAVSTDFTF